MQPYLNDGEETLQVSFSLDEVAQYYSLLKQPTSKTVPPMLCACVWPKFKMFQAFAKETLLLTETVINNFHDIYVENQYTAKLTKIKQRKIKQFIQYTYNLEINKNSIKCINITQTFLERVN